MIKTREEMKMHFKRPILEVASEEVPRRARMLRGAMADQTGLMMVENDLSAKEYFFNLSDLIILDFFPTLSISTRHRETEE